LILKRNGCELEVVIKTGDNQTVLKPLQIRWFCIQIYLLIIFVFTLISF
jgi:hypothetical protein